MTQKKAPSSSLDPLKILTRGITLPKTNIPKKSDQVPVLLKTDGGSLRKSNDIRVYGEDIPAPCDSFAEILKEHPDLLSAISFEVPSPVQAQALPLLLTQPDRDAIIVAPTGTGKTLVYLLALHEPSIVLAPTMELAEQIEEVARSVRPSHQILISTPLRCLNKLRDSKQACYHTLVLDEADRLMEGNLLDQLDQILSRIGTRPKRIILLSATIPTGVEQLARTFLSENTARIEVGKPFGSLAGIKQEVIYVGQEAGKSMALQNLIVRSDGTMTPPGIVFVQEAERGQEVLETFSALGLRASFLHSGLDGSQRHAILKAFRAKQFHFLITTELLARGIDLPDILLVLNWDMPITTASYIHRIGRTGRASRTGTAVTFFTETDIPALPLVVNVIKASGQTVEGWMEKVKDGRRLLKKSLERGATRDSLEKKLQRQKERKRKDKQAEDRKKRKQKKDETPKAKDKKSKMGSKK